MFRAKEYRSALTRVDALLTTPNLGNEDRVFLSRQHDICQAAIEGKPYRASFSVGSAGGNSAAAASAAKTPAIADCGPRALLLVCEQLEVTSTDHKPVTLPALRAAADSSGDGTTLQGLAHAAKTVAGLKAVGVQMDRSALARLSTPAIAWVDGNHYLSTLGY